MISLHLALLFRRLRSEQAGLKAFSQSVFDLFFKDMDRSLREMGSGDLGVPKRIRKMTGLFYGLLTGINEALDAGDVAALEAVIARNILGDMKTGHVADLARYVEAEAKRLEALPVAQITSGQLSLGDAA